MAKVGGSAQGTGTKTALIIGSGIGGLSLGLRLQSLGIQTTILEKLDAPGGRAYVRKAQGFTFDMGPTVITVPHFIEELFALERGRPALTGPDFPDSVLGEDKRIRAGVSGGPATSKYVTLVPILPFYRIYFEDGSFFDYDGDPQHTREQVSRLGEPGDLEGYERFHNDAKAIFERGFVKLGYTYFKDVGSMLRVAPDLLRLDAVRTLFSFASRHFKSPKLRRIFSFETLLVGGNPLSVPAIYSMIHFVEKTWGIHFAMGGTGALVNGLAKKFEELGGQIRYNSEVTQINVDPASPRGARGAARRVTGVTLKSGIALPADLVVSNGDYANTYMKLIDPQYRFWQSDTRVKLARQSMSAVVVYFGFRADGLQLNLRHHNIILSERYEALLTDIFDRKVLTDEMSHYVHLPTLTDPSLAPPGHHAAYTLIPVPHNGSGVNWSKIGEEFTDRALRFLDEAGYIPGLCERLVYKSYITPDYFENGLNSYLGNAFGPEPILTQSAFFRPHNKSEDFANLYLVGAGTQPGGGTPSVMMSAKMTARVIAQDLELPMD